MRTKLTLFVALCALGFTLAPWRLTMACELPKCHTDADCSSSCNKVPSGDYEECKEEYKQAAKSSSGQGVPNATTCGKKWHGDGCKTQSGTCGGYSWEAGDCDSSS